jgi:hypothetical protein
LVAASNIVPASDGFSGLFGYSALRQPSNGLPPG